MMMHVMLYSMPTMYAALFRLLDLRNLPSKN